MAIILQRRVHFAVAWRQHASTDRSSGSEESIPLNKSCRLETRMTPLLSDSYILTSLRLGTRTGVRCEHDDWEQALRGQALRNPGD